MAHGFTRPDPDDVDTDDPDLWCIVIAGEECEPGTAQCPECGHFPDAGEGEHSWQPNGTWMCAGCGHEIPVVPYSNEDEE